MNSLEYLSKQYDVAFTPLASSPSTGTDPTISPSPVVRMGSPSRRNRVLSRFPPVRALLELWTWVYTQWAVLVFMKKFVTGADLDLDDDDPGHEPKGESVTAALDQSPIVEDPPANDVVTRTVSVETVSFTNVRRRAVWPSDSASPPSSSSRGLPQLTSEPSYSRSVISLNTDGPQTLSSSLTPQATIEDVDEDGNATAVLSPALELTPPTPNRHSTPLPLPQTLLLNPLATSLLTRPSKRRNIPEASSSFNPTPRNRTPLHLPKTLILDLDETLIHSTSRTPTNYGGQNLFSAGGLGFGIGSGGLGFGIWGGRKTGPGHMVEVVLGGRSTLYHVYKRPFVDYFLKKVSSWYTLVVFTASMQEYADPVIDWLDAGRGILVRRFFRESCTQLPNGSYSKDLTIVESDLSRVALLDNSPVSYSTFPANGIPVEGWTSDPSDEALLDLLPFLDSLRFTSDVRHVLGIRGF